MRRPVLPLATRPGRGVGRGGRTVIRAGSLPCRAYLGALFQFVWIGHFKESPPAPAAAGEKRRVGGWEKRTKTQVARERKQRQQAQLAPCE
jgi:hypothetical protein